MRLISATLTLFLVLASGSASAGTQWVEGANYIVIPSARSTAPAPGKVSVVEVFSYACPACNDFYPTADKLRAALPKNAELSFVAAAFRPDEDWPMFQRAFYTAQELNIDRKMHDTMFDAVWRTGELAIMDPRTKGPRLPPPSIEDAAKFYSLKTGVTVDAFLAASKSFGVDFKIRAAQDFITSHRVDHTPTIVVNGKYLTDTNSAGGYDQLIELVKWLVAKESH